ncbi:hypothetical protein DIKCMJMK_01593 [Shewanella oneidensis]|nr:hypothetical protein [Shewanella oneidensis]
MSTHKIHKIHTAEFKVEALSLADKIGVAAAARELKLYNSQLYNWRSASEHKITSSELEVELDAEVARLKRQLAEQTEDLAILKRRLPTSRRIKNSQIRVYPEGVQNSVSG